MLAGRVRTQRVAAPIIDRGDGPRRIEGWVIDVASPSVSGARMLIAPVFISGVAPSEMPHCIRVTVAREAVIGPGQAVTFSAMIGPPPPPASPGAYDFARDAWFDAEGSRGCRSTGAQRRAAVARGPKVLSGVLDAPWWSRRTGQRRHVHMWQIYMSAGRQGAGPHGRQLDPTRTQAWGVVCGERGGAAARLPSACDGVPILDAEDFAAGGSAELYRTRQGWRIVWAQPLRGKRPWVR